MIEIMTWMNGFLQVLDEGVAKNSKGEEINFSNTTIIMTSNLGCDKESIGFGGGAHYEDINKFFGVEFVNRIGNVIRFNKIDFDICKRLVSSKLGIVRKFYKNKNISCTFSNKLVLDIVNLCEYEKYGARKIDGIIREKVEGVIVDKILEGENKIRIDKVLSLV